MSNPDVFMPIPEPDVRQRGASADPLETERETGNPTVFVTPVSGLGNQIMTVPSSVLSHATRAFRKTLLYLQSVYDITRDYYSPYPSVTTTRRAVLSAWWLLVKRVLFALFVCAALYLVASDTISYAKRKLGSGAVASYDTLLARCERALNRDSAACGVLVSEHGTSGHRMLCLWTDPSRTELMSFMNPAVTAAGTLTHTVTERQVGCKDADTTTRRRYGTATVYFDSIIDPGTHAAQKLESKFTAFCAQHAMEFPIGTPCA